MPSQKSFCHTTHLELPLHANLDDPYEAQYDESKYHTFVLNLDALQGTKVGIFYHISM